MVLCNSTQRQAKARQENSRCGRPDQPSPAQPNAPCCSCRVAALDSATDVHSMVLAVCRMRACGERWQVQYSACLMSTVYCRAHQPVSHSACSNHSASSNKHTVQRLVSKAFFPTALIARRVGLWLPPRPRGTCPWPRLPAKPQVPRPSPPFPLSPPTFLRPPSCPFKP